MENTHLRKSFEIATNNLVEKFKKDLKCIGGFLIGSASHDMIWEWSDLELLFIFDDSYKGPSSFSLFEEEVVASVKIVKRSAFKNYLSSANVSDYWYCALSKSTLLFSKDASIKTLFDDSFHIGDRDREIEMLLGFSQAVYYLNKAEKNFRVKKNSQNATYFLFHLAEGIAWLEVARNRVFPEREIISQASDMAPEIFDKIYKPLIYEVIDDVLINNIIEFVNEYLKNSTFEVYAPIIEYLKVNKSLKNFSLETRMHGFGINYDWLFRMGIVGRSVEMVKINNRDESFLQIDYRIKED